MAELHYVDCFVRGLAVALIGLLWAAAAFFWLVLYPTSFLIACALCALVVARHRQVARRAVRDATVRQIAFAQVIRCGGKR